MSFRVRVNLVVEIQFFLNIAGRRVAIHGIYIEKDLLHIHIKIVFADIGVRLPECGIYRQVDGTYSKEDRGDAVFLQ